MNSKKKIYAHSIIFGIEDSLVSTTGLIAGMAVATSGKDVVIIGALIAIAVEALSMGVGEYLSDDSIEEMNPNHRASRNAFKSGTLMLISYALAGLIPLLPIIILSYPLSLYLTVIFAFIGLFLLGYIKGKILHTSPLKGAIKILLAGGAATLLGIAVGVLLKV